MRHLIWALVVTVLAISRLMAQSAPAKAAPFSTKFHGDGGGYKHPDKEVGPFFETTSPGPAELKPERPQVPAKVTPEIQPIKVSPSRPRPRPFAPAPSSTENGKRLSQATDRAIGEELSPLPNSVRKGASPAAKPPAKTTVSGADVADGGIDSASDDARRDYEQRLLAAAPQPRRGGLADSKELPLTSPELSALPASTGEGMLFVSLELDPRQAGSLRDAVAGLGEAAAFRPDARFQPQPVSGGSVRISGWIAASRLVDAIARPGVVRVAVELGSRPAADNRLTGDYLLKLRVTDAARPDESVAASVRALTIETGFKLDRIVAIETAADEGATVLVSGTMPVSRLSRALGLAGVIKISAALPESADFAAAPAAAPARVDKKEGFLKFVMARSLWLVLLTALLALSAFGRILKSLAVFVPYR